MSAADDGEVAPQAKRRTPAVQRSLDILELFLDGHETLTPPEVVAALGLPRTTVHELLNTLADRGYLERRSGSGGASFALGLRLFELGNRYSRRLALVDVTKAVAGEVSTECDETVHIGVLDDLHVIYVAKVDTTRAVRMVSAEGARLPANCTAVGKALLAHEDADALGARITEAGGLVALTHRSLTDPGELAAELARVRSDGFAVESCESNEDVCCVAAPIRDSGGRVVAGMSISVPIQRWTERRRAALITLVRTGADEASRRLGYYTETRSTP